MIIGKRRVTAGQKNTANQKRVIAAAEAITVQPMSATDAVPSVANKFRILKLSQTALPAAAAAIEHIRISSDSFDFDNLTATCKVTLWLLVRMHAIRHPSVLARACMNGRRFR